MKIKGVSTSVRRVLRVVGVITFSFTLCINAGIFPKVYAAGETITAGSSATTELKTATPIAGISIDGVDDSVVPVKLFVTSGTLSMTVTSGLTFKDVNGNTISNPQTGATLYFSGTRSNVNTALATLRYTRNSTGTDNLEISLVSPGEVFFSGSNHLYEYVSSTLDWNNAQTAASGRTKYGATGYLATITSQSENDFVSARLAGAGWMGASDSVTEGTWKWVAGPENGTTFCIGNNPCAVQSGQYANWSTGEPNDYSTGEDCAQFLSGGSGKWNDLPCSGTTLPGYVVEYGAPGNMPTVAAASIALTTSDTVAPTAPGKPSATTPTNDSTPPITWAASTDSGTGLKNPSYTLEWSTSATFVSVTGSATTNLTTYSPTSTLSDGTWYFRVKATDNANNIATSSISDPVVTDTTSPTDPGTPTIGRDWTNDTTPTFSWTASLDTGSGLATNSYSVQWGQDTTFTALAGSAGSGTNSFTIPNGLNLGNGTWYLRVKAYDVVGNQSAWSNYATIHVDTVAPTVSGVTSADGITNTQEVITWTTDKITSSRVAYGPTTSYGTGTSESDTSPRVLSHSVTLSNLTSCSIYHYRVTSEDEAGNVTNSSDQTFITKGCAGSADIVTHTDAPITTAAGGSVQLETIKIQIPTAYATDNADFQVKKITRDPALGAIGGPLGLLLAGNKIYDIKALRDDSTAISTFDKPITITLQYIDDEVAALSETSLAIYRWDPGTGWAKLSNCVVDIAANTVTCTTQHFSTFVLFGETKPVVAHISSGGITRAYARATSIVPEVVATTNTSTENDSKEPNQSVNIDIQGNAVKKSGKYSRIIWFGIVAFLFWFFWWILAIRRRRKKDEES